MVLTSNTNPLYTVTLYTLTPSDTIKTIIEILI